MSFDDTDVLTTSTGAALAIRHMPAKGQVRGSFK